MAESTVESSDGPRSITSSKLNDVNYLAWAHAVQIYLRGEDKLKYITDLPPRAYSDDWNRNDAKVMRWLWHSLEPHIANTVAFCETSKNIWDCLAKSFSQKSNASCVYELYEKIFTCKQNGKSLSEYYGILKGLWDQMLHYHPLTTNLTLLKRQWEDFMVASLLVGLDPSLNGVKDHIIASETLPTAANAYYRISQSSKGKHDPGFVPPNPVQESSTLVGNQGGRDKRGGRGGRVRGVSRGGRHSHGRGDQKCDFCQATNHTEPSCWKKYGKPDNAQNVISGPLPPTQLIIEQEIELCLVGLQNAGKISLVNVFATGGYSEDMIPTEDSVNKGNVTIKFWDLGGEDRFRSMWTKYCRGVSVIVYVVDVADYGNTADALCELLKLVSEPSLSGIPLLVLGNKMDKPWAFDNNTLFEMMELGLINDREVRSFIISCRNSTNIASVIDWLVKHSKPKNQEDSQSF